MITASHNPKNDNGYKVYASNACQIIPPMDQAISDCIMKNLEPWTWDDTLVDKSPILVDPFEEVVEKYYQALTRLRVPVPEWTEPLFCYTAMHGVGLEFAKKALDTFGIKCYTIVPEQASPDPDFSTVPFPNPEEKGALDFAIKKASNLNCKIILANDPDADRFAAAELVKGKWHVFSGNQLGLIFASFVLDQFGKDCAMLASTVSSRMLERMAKAEGFEFYDTLTGFKWLGNKALDLEDQGKSVAFAYEEAIGFMVGDVVRDKDGISALGFFCQHALRLYSQGLTVSDHLDSLYKKYGYVASNNGYLVSPSKEATVKVFNQLRTRNGVRAYPETINGVKVVSVRDLTSGFAFDSDSTNHIPSLPCSDGEMVTFKLSNGVVLTVRASGTEPKIKYYSEIFGDDLDQITKQLDNVIDSFIREHFDPEKYGFTWKK